MRETQHTPGRAMMMLDALMVAEYELGCTAIGTANGIRDLTAFEADLRRDNSFWAGQWKVRAVKDATDSRVAELVEVETARSSPFGLAVFPLYGRQGGASC